MPRLETVLNIGYRNGLKSGFTRKKTDGTRRPEAVLPRLKLSPETPQGEIK